ncbi:hypothetical protein PRN20_17810 [Devosia sp. ZB163]|uniref:hypothetical protein n=1 Tax=Devosia sp. ZB163 TaxID=3025938 RepID=UPI00235DC577|nr:hypothetical protein [Devosia sp. ZB163]MDC9825593.1 hypothetical protein [Devosia sp. ZB163]
MEAIVSILVQLVAGGVGGNGLAAVVKQVNLGPTGNTIAGAIGGWLGTWLATQVPGLSGLVGGAAAAAGAGGLDIAALAGQGLTGLIGGGVLTAIAGLIKNATMKSST